MAEVSPDLLARIRAFLVEHHDVVDGPPGYEREQRPNLAMALTTELDEEAGRRSTRDRVERSSSSLPASEKELRELLEKATPGLWKPGRSDLTWYDGDGKQAANVYHSTWSAGKHLGHDLPLVLGTFKGNTTLAIDPQANAELVAAMRNSLPALLSSLAAMREALEKIAGGHCGNLIDVAKNATSQAEAQRLFHMAFSKWMQDTARAALAQEKP